MCLLGIVDEYQWRSNIRLVCVRVPPLVNNFHVCAACYEVARRSGVPPLLFGGRGQRSRGQPPSRAEGDFTHVGALCFISTWGYHELYELSCV